MTHNPEDAHIPEDEFTQKNDLPRHKTTWTASELLKTEFSEPVWLVQELLPEGLALLAGRPKVGKSWLALQWAGAVGNGGKVWGRATPKGKVLYLALEDNPRRLKNRIEQQQWLNETDVVFETTWPNLTTENGMDELENRIVNDSFSFVIIDTLSRAAKFKQQEVEETTNALAPLHKLASELGITILVIDHHRKTVNGVDDIIDSVMGSTGKTAVADTIMGLFRARGEPSIATLKAKGRDQEDKELALKFDGEYCCWQSLGNANEVTTKEAEKEILEAIKELGDDATQTEIIELTGKKRSNVSKILKSLTERGFITGGGKGKPYRIVPKVS